MNSGLKIYDGHAAIAVDAPCLCRNAPRNLHDLRPQMPCPCFKECCLAFNSYFEKQALKIFSFITGMNWKLINVYQGDNQIKNENKTCLPSGFPGKGGGRNPMLDLSGMLVVTFRGYNSGF